MPEMYQAKMNALNNNLLSGIKNWEAISVEKQQLDLATQLSEDKKRMEKIMTDLSAMEGDYEDIPQYYDQLSQQIMAEGQKAMDKKGGWAQRNYSLQSLEMQNSYKARITNVYQGLVKKDGQNQAIAQFDEQVANVGYDKAGYTKSLTDFSVMLDKSNFWTPGEKERMKSDYQTKFLLSAVKGGYQSAFYSDPNATYTEKGANARDWLNNQDLGELTSEQLQAAYTSIQAMENSAYTAQKRYEDEQDNNLETSFWGLVKNDNIQGLADAFAQKQFYNADTNKYWYDFLNRLTNPPTGSTANEEKQAAANAVAEIRWKRENGEITQEQMKQEAEILYSQNASNANMAPVLREFMDYSRDPKLSDNDSYKNTLTYVDTQLANLKLDEDPALKAVIVDALQHHIHSEGDDFLQTEEEYRKIADALMLKPTIKKMNDKISTGLGDRNTINSAEEITQHFQNGNFRALLDVDEDGNINYDRYKSWVAAWGIRGKEENIEEFVEEYVDEFGRAAVRDFGTGAMIHVDQDTRRPMVEEDGETYVLHIIDSEEKKRLKDLGLEGIHANVEAWYKWNDEKGTWEYHSEVGKD